ncbi:hypothetical protein PYW07_007872 [Mythimna separata]|uniref:MD-2-related lipid-recognition domain-containing protein n=1 Tax=Mythimna separata TaxID=271217 RepID=A0AAD7YQL1_MYTSE|nr:hypothetical protein PYW07_007872 [Mythimna separata]
MSAPRVLVCLAVLAASALATNVQQCPGLEIENLSENVQLSPCKKPPCKLKKGTSQAISITFTVPEGKDMPAVTNHVTAEVFGAPLPFVGVDGNSICEKVYSEDGEKAACPLKAGTKYTYKDSFPILSFYPSIAVKVHWALQDANSKDLLCFEVPARIV